MVVRLMKRTIGLGSLLAAIAALVRQTGLRWERNEDPIPPDDYVVPEGESRIVTTDDGAELAVTIAGEGPTVVLAHCWTGAREVWAPVANLLVRSGNRVVLYDQRGHGSSTVGAQGCTIARLGMDLATILEQLDIHDAVLAGHSMGSMTVLSLGAYEREVMIRRARGLVLVSTAASGLSFGPLDKLAQTAVGQSFLDPLLRSPIGLAMVRATVGRHACRSHLALTRDLLVACPPQIRRDCLSAMQKMDLRSALRGLDIPTTILSGRFDALTPPWLARQVASSIIGSSIVSVPDGGHMLVLEDPDKVAEAIKAALGAHEAVISLN